MEDFYCSEVGCLPSGVGLEDGVLVWQSLLLFGRESNNAGVGQALPRGCVGIVWWTLILGLVSVKTCGEFCGAIR